MTTVIVEFDGKAFVPQNPIELPVGTRGTVAIALPQPPSIPAPRKPSPEAIAERDRYIADLNESEPYFPTVEDAIGYARKRP